MKRLLCLFLGLVILTGTIVAQTKTTGIISGKVIDSQTNAPVEYANVVLVDTNTRQMASGAVTDSTGKFRLTNISNGIYILEYSFIGYEKQRSRPIGISRKHTRVDMGVLLLKPSMVNLKDVTITGEKNMMVNKIDRKVFNVQQDIMAQTGTVTEVLQNIPSITVDMDGNISLRGSGNVTILINGRPSSMAGTATLDQMPASLIEKIEVITNPSAKYRPDGTAGIINIVLKKDQKAGFNGSLGGNVGNHERYNANLQLNMNTGKVNLYGSAGFRKDYRWRNGELTSQAIDTSNQKSTYLSQYSEGYSKPVSTLATLGLDWKIDKQNTTGISTNMNYRGFDRFSTTGNVYRTDSLNPSERFTRNQEGPDYETSLGSNLYFEHLFGNDEEHKLRTDFVLEYDDEHENYTYTTVYDIPQINNATDYNYNHIRETKLNLAMTYSRPLWKDASLETGYDGNMEISDQDFIVRHFDPEKGVWNDDSILTNHYQGNQTVHALYGTFSWKIDKFSFMAGLRPELALVNLDFITRNATVNQTYFAIYPTLHLSLESGKNEWQLNYSRRVNRPRPEDMNPVPEYRDPRNYFVGNPDLKPEEIHSVEFGYAVKTRNLNLIPAVFYRYRTHGFTTITSSPNDSVLVTTMENLAHDQSAGLDFSGNAQIIRIFNLNFSASGFYNEIDASNIGYGKNKGAFSWNAKLNASVAITKTTLLQANGQYRSSTLTPQGMRSQTWAVNLGLRQDFWKKRISFLLTITDLFNSNASKTTIDTPVLVQESMRRRDAPVIYAGFVFKFNTSSKKEKEVKFEFESPGE